MGTRRKYDSGLSICWVLNLGEPPSPAVRCSLHGCCFFQWCVLPPPFLLSTRPVGPLLLLVMSPYSCLKEIGWGVRWSICNSKFCCIAICLVCAGKKSVTHAVCMPPCTPVVLTHISISVVMLIVWAVLVVDLSPGRAVKGVGRDGWNYGSMKIRRRLPVSVTRISPRGSGVLVELSSCKLALLHFIIWAVRDFTRLKAFFFSPGICWTALHQDALLDFG